MSKKIGFPLTFVLALLSVVSFVFYFTTQNQSVYSDKLIEAASADFKTNLKAFLSSADKTRNAIGKGAVGYNTDTLTQDELNQVFTHEISHNKYLKGILLFNEKINYVIVKEDKTWATTYSYSNTEQMLEWERLDSKLEVVSQWSDTYNFFMNEENKKIVSHGLNLQDRSVWRTAQSEIPDKRELFINIFEVSDSVEQKYTIGLLYKTTEVAGDFANIFKFKNPLINIIDFSGKMITPIKTSDTSKISVYKQLSIEVQKILNDWTKDHNNQPYSYSYENDKDIYWTRIDTIDDESIKGFTITVSENDIKQSQKLQNQFYLYMAAGFLAMVLFLLYLIYRKKTANTNIKPFEKHEESDIIKLIKAGETEFVEFKSSLRYDYRLEKENKILEDVILKSIAAFANAKGGTLFIGVDDDMNIMGLENDFGTLKKSDADYFELHLRRLINNQYGISFSNNNLLVYFPNINSKQICVIQINASIYPLYLKTKTKQGQQLEKFYVRTGNASQQISSLKEINEYINRRFKKED